jgi:hypothetical protein
VSFSLSRGRDAGTRLRHAHDRETAAVAASPDCEGSRAGLIGQAKSGPKIAVSCGGTNDSWAEACRSDERDPLAWAKAFAAHHERLTIDEPQSRLSRSGGGCSSRCYHEH